MICAERISAKYSTNGHGVALALHFSVGVASIAIFVYTEKIFCEVYISGGLWRRLVTKMGQMSRQCRLAVLEMLDDILTLRLTSLADEFTYSGSNSRHPFRKSVFY